MVSRSSWRDDFKNLIRSKLPRPLGHDDHLQTEVHAVQPFDGRGWIRQGPVRHYRPRMHRLRCVSQQQVCNCLWKRWLDQSLRLFYERWTSRILASIYRPSEARKVPVLAKGFEIPVLSRARKRYIQMGFLRRSQHARGCFSFIWENQGWAGFGARKIK